jgi:hypothetical protein
VFSRYEYSNISVSTTCLSFSHTSPWRFVALPPEPGVIQSRVSIGRMSSRFAWKWAGMDRFVVYCWVCASSGFPVMVSCDSVG